MDLIWTRHGLMEAPDLIGNTGSGIGPTYSTKMTRSGVRMTDMLNHERLETRLRTIAGGFKKRYGDLLSDYDVEAELARLKVIPTLYLAFLTATNTFPEPH